MRGVTEILVHSQGKRLALGASAASVHWVGAWPMFGLGDGSVLIASLDGENARVQAHDGAVLCAAVHPDRTRLVTGGDDGRLALTTPAGESETLAKLGRKWVEHVVANPVSGVIAASIGKDVAVLKNGAESHRFTFPATPGGLAIDAKGRRLVVSHYNGATLHYVLVADDRGVPLNWAGSHLSVTISPDAEFVLTSMQENELHGWKLPEKTDLRMSGYAAKTRSFSWDKKGRHLATSGADCVVVWPFVGKVGPQGKQPALIAPRDALVTAVAFHPTEDIIAIGYADGAALAVRLKDQAALALDEAGEGPVTAIAWSPDGMHIALGDEAGRGAIVDMGVR